MQRAFRFGPILVSQWMRLRVDGASQTFTWGKATMLRHKL
jgi:hypothetical protein